MKLDFISKGQKAAIKASVSAAYLFYFTVAVISLVYSLRSSVNSGNASFLGNLGNEFVFFCLLAMVTAVQAAVFHLYKGSGNRQLNIQTALSAVKFFIVMSLQAGIGSQNIYFGGSERSDFYSWVTIFAIIAVAAVFLAELVCAVWLKLRLKECGANGK